MTASREDHRGEQSGYDVRFGKFCSRSSHRFVQHDTAHPVRPSTSAAGRLRGDLVVVTLQYG